MTQKSILLVEDNPDDAALALRAFKKNHIANSVFVARDGVEALDYLQLTKAHVADEPGELPTVILLDLKLPRMDGLQVLRHIRADARTKLLPVVVLTSSKEEQDILASYALGANSYIRKPVDYDQFLYAIGQLGLYWLELNELSG